MGRATGGDFVMGLWFDRVYEVGKLNRILNEKYRHIVADQIEVAFVGEKFDRESTYISHRIAGAPRALYG